MANKKYLVLSFPIKLILQVLELNCANGQTNGKSNTVRTERLPIISYQLYNRQGMADPIPYLPNSRYGQDPYDIEDDMPPMTTTTVKVTSTTTLSPSDKLQQKLAVYGEILDLFNGIFTFINGYLSALLLIYSLRGSIRKRSADFSYRGNSC